MISARTSSSLLVKVMLLASVFVLVKLLSNCSECSDPFVISLVEDSDFFYVDSPLLQRWAQGALDWCRTFVSTPRRCLLQLPSGVAGADGCPTFPSASCAVNVLSTSCKSCASIALSCAFLVANVHDLLASVNSIPRFDCGGDSRITPCELSSALYNRGRAAFVRPVGVLGRCF